MGEWTEPERALEYLSRADEIPHRHEGEAVLLEMLPEGVGRVLDLGCGDGRLLDVVLGARPGCSGVALDFSPPMLEKARGRFEAYGRVGVVEHDFSDPLPGLGEFDAVVSFSDALAVVRKELWTAQRQQSFCVSSAESETVEIPREFMERLTDALCYAA